MGKYIILGLIVGIICKVLGISLILTVIFAVSIGATLGYINNYRGMKKWNTIYQQRKK